MDSPAEEVKIPARKIEYVGISFSPDSQYIYEAEKDDTLIGKLYAVPILGSSPTSPILVDIDGPVSFSPSGDQFAFVRYLPIQNGSTRETESHIEIAQRDGSRRRTLLSLRSLSILRRVAWSPKGNLIAAFLVSNLSERAEGPLLDLVGLNRREHRELLPSWSVIGQPAWTRDGKTVIVSVATRTEGNDQAQLREIAVTEGLTHDVTKELAGYKNAVITRDGQELVATKVEPKASLWISAPNNLGTGQSFPAEAEEHLALAWSDANHLVVNSRRNGFPNLWRFDVASQNRTDLTSEPHVEQGAAPIPGTNSIVFSSNRTGQFHLWKFEPDANRYVQLTSGANYDEAPSVTPDGRWIVYTSWTSNLPHLRKVATTGGESVQVGSYLAREAQLSPDGNAIACYMQDPVSLRWEAAVVPFEGSDASRVIANAQLPLRWSPDGKALTSVITDRRGVSNVWTIPLDNSAAQELTRFDDDMILAFSWSPDGERLACIRASLGADVVLFRRVNSR